MAATTVPSEIQTQIGELKSHIEQLEQQIIKLEILAKGSENEDEVKRIRAEIEDLKRGKENAKNKYNGLISQIQQLGNQEIDRSGVEGRVEGSSSHSFKARIEGFKKYCDVKSWLDDLMKTRSNDNEAGSSSGTKNVNVEGREENMFPLVSSESQDEAMRGEEMINREGNANKRVMEMFMRSFSSSDLERQDSYSFDADDIITNIEGLQERMSKLMQENQDAMRNDEIEETLEALKGVRAKVFELGTEISSLLVDILFLKPEKEEMVAKCEGLKFSLESLIEGDNTLVISRIINLLEIFSKMVDKEGLMKASGQIIETGSEGDKMDQMIDQLAEEIVRLECMVKQASLFEPRKLKKRVVTEMEENLKQCGEELKRTHGKVNELKVLSTFISESSHLETNEIEKKSMEDLKAKINEMWKEVPNE